MDDAEDREGGKLIKEQRERRKVVIYDSQKNGGDHRSAPLRRTVGK